MTTLTAYLSQNINGFLVPFPTVWVRLRNNSTSVDYVSTAYTDINGKYTVNNVPGGIYTVYTGPTAISTPNATGDANFVVAEELGYFNVKDYGAVGDGVTNDTVAIQAAITAAGNMGTVFFPASSQPYLFSTLTVPHGVEVLGSGWISRVQGPFGVSIATWLAAASGTILRSTATSGPAITFHSEGVVGTFRMSKIAVIGPGSGTSIGIRVGEVTTGVSVQDYFSDVLAANFATGWYMTGPEDSTFISCRARGCSTGFVFTNAFNQNVLVNTEVQFSSVDGIVMLDGSVNLFAGGLLQNLSGTSGLRHVAGESNVYQSFYYESSVLPTNSIVVTAGSRNVWRDWWFSSPLQNALIINGGGGNTFQNFRGGGTPPVVINTGNTMTFNDYESLSLSGAGAGAARILDGTTGFQLGSASTGGLSIPTGTKLKLDNTTGANYIQRETSTGHTLIGSGSGLTRIIGNAALNGTANPLLFIGDANDNGTKGIILNMPTGVGNGTSIVDWQEAGVDKWQIYKLASDPSLYFRDMVNARMQLTLTPGASASASTTTIGSRVTISDALTITTGGQTITAGNLTLTAGDLIVTAGKIVISTAVSKIVPGATSLSLRNNADSADNLIITDVGAATLRDKFTAGAATSATSTITAASGTILTLNGNAGGLGDTSQISFQSGRGLIGYDGAFSGGATFVGGTKTVILRPTSLGVTGQPAIQIIGPDRTLGQEAPSIQQNANTITLTGGFATQRFAIFTQATMTGAFTVTDSATLAVAGPPIAAGGATLTNKHALWIQSGALTLAGDLRRSRQSPAYAASLTIDATVGEIVSIGALTGNITINAPSNPSIGQNLTLEFTQDGTGGRTITWNAVFKVNWIPSTAASALSTITFYYNGTSWIQLSYAGGLT